MQYLEDIKARLDNLTNSQERYLELNKVRERLLEDIDTIQTSLTKIRKHASTELVSKIQNELHALGMNNAKIDVDFGVIPEKYSRSGKDAIELMFSANTGFDLKPLNKVVSGGEMSRVMLAYKSVVSTVDSVQTIVFDEIDTGLSGNVASVVAKYLARLSTKGQVIAVSHLPQICAMADTNIKVEKFSDEVSTRTTAKILNDDELIIEIARLMGASSSNQGLTVSRDLKEQSNKYKISLAVS